MVRWAPDARARLQSAALELFAARGFEQTTAADIAAAVGLTERTFFRHFADKREVIFQVQAEFERGFLDGIAAAPPSASAMEVVSAALESAEGFFPEDRRDYARLRQSVISANPSLQERELLKMTALSASIATALREHGIAEPHATLAAESGVTVFGVAFRQWIAEGETRSLFAIERDVLRDLRSVTQEAHARGAGPAEPVRHGGPDSPRATRLRS